MEIKKSLQKYNTTIISLIILFFVATITYAEENSKNILPDFYRLQFAGHTGLFTLSAGKSFFNDRYSASIGYGYAPDFIADTKVHTLSIKQKLYTKRRIKLGENDIRPSFNLSVMYEMGKNSTLIYPDKYPKGYYFTNSFHFPLAIGLNFRHNLTNKTIRKIEYSVEGGGLMTYIYHYVVSRKYANNRIFSLALATSIYF
jgi:hypothetical protein